MQSLFLLKLSLHCTAGTGSLLQRPCTSSAVQTDFQQEQEVHLNPFTVVGQT